MSVELEIDGADRDGGGGDSASVRDEDELGDATGWGGVPRSQDGQDDEGSVSTRLMFASDDRRR